MKRTVEFVIGLIGGILGLLLSLFIVIGCISYTSSNTSSGGIGEYIIITSSIALIIQIGLLVLACCVNKINNKTYGICMIVLSIISLFLGLFILFIPVVLQIISGAFAFRSLKQETN
ncbi:MULTISPECIES: DUF4064 domain-containing protein [Bacillus cereus group]|uniref:DUF4064 domain-containing protein n=1 Tax=Bacillus cereus group TaxID=86661 RepID=UPI00032E542A|nr:MULTISPECIES: DUF4064 domain-containing protein [Bacillus cereus group]EOP60203.1 hypothetical protein IKQ_06093 [Bacillus cereus VDM053]MED1093377.1 DUF4064 domain-containing protein [Bacillus paramycoides]MED1116922.1 DUF4064 domain-containing protein [Bacillus paramycoides]PDZ81738.1 DUF4064 domain-containing protein [Bacillus toyonensis]PEA74126.1 DUF4064 domain-containing protein [Bacillus toyonensis]